MTDTIQSPDVATPLENTPVPEFSATRGPRTLVVEDNFITKIIIRRFLTIRLGYHDVVMADNGSLAIEAIEASEDSFDIIFMDTEMLVMDGFAVVRRIPEMEDQAQASSDVLKRAKMITLVTKDRGEETSALDAGADLCIKKPVQINDLDVTIRECERDRLARMDVCV